MKFNAVKNFSQPLIGIIDTGFNSKAIDHSKTHLGRDISGDNDSLLGEENNSLHGSTVLQIIQGEKSAAPIWLSCAVGSGRWAKSLIEFIDFVKISGYSNAIVNLSFDLIKVDSNDGVTIRHELTSYERAALEYAHQQGVLLVAAAGNQGSSMSALGQASQEFDNIITVGAAEGMSRAPYSSYGDGLTLLADGQFSGSAKGTSIAAARVTNATSQVWTRNSQLSYYQVAHILKMTAANLNSPGWDKETGFGLLNLSNAFSLAASTTPIPKLILSNKTCPIFESSVTESLMLERPAWFGEDVWHTVVTVSTFPFKTAGEAAKYLTDKSGDGIKAALNPILPDGVGNLLNEFIDRTGEKIQGVVEREIQYVKELPDSIDRTVNDLFSDELWQNFGGWFTKNAIHAAELGGAIKITETIADIVKYNTRSLDNREKDLAQKVFGNSINLEIVRLDEWSYSSLFAFAADDDAT